MNESFDKPLCPDRIDKQDYLDVKKQLNQTESELLDFWYKFVIDTDCYELRYFNNLNLNEHVNMTRADGNQKLVKLMEIFQKTLTNDCLKQKYLKSLQEIEVELAVNYLNPNSIIWFERTNNSNPTTATTTTMNTILNKLQSIVFTHNYKNYKYDQEKADELIKNSIYLNTLSQFIEEACKKSIDFLIKELKPFDTYLS